MYRFERTRTPLAALRGWVHCSAAKQPAGLVNINENTSAGADASAGDRSEHARNLLVSMKKTTRKNGCGAAQEAASKEITSRNKRETPAVVAGMSRVRHRASLLRLQIACRHVADPPPRPAAVPGAPLQTL